MSDQDTRDLETDDELRARLRAFAQQVKERTDTEAALQRMPRQSRPRTLGRLAIAACFVAAVAVATVVLVERWSGDTIDTSEATAASAPTTTLAKEAPPRVIPLPPEGAAPSAPVKGVFVLSLQACEGPSSLPWSGILALYADGRLLWHTYDDPIEGDPGSWNGPRAKTGWLEQRLTPEGTELLRSELVSSGLLGPVPLPPDYSCPAGSYRADARIGDRDEYYVGKLPRDLVERIAEPASWLPASAWEDREVRPFVPASYSVCISGLEPRISVAEIATALPARVGDLVRARDWGENHWGPSEWFWCTVVATEDARTFAEALDAAALERNEHPLAAGPEYLFEYHDAFRSPLLHINFYPDLGGSTSGGIFL
jgi:hypothetical protein